MIIYGYYSNAILARPLKSRLATELLQSIKENTLTQTSEVSILNCIL